jgi:S-DNA-T family DNA segregation ATPase FtsK/SpoIIIE
LNGGDKMTEARYPRPCPIPGHPQDAPGEAAALAPDSAWSRLRAWHLHAPAERLPLPLVLTAWPSAWVLHAAHVPGHVMTYAAAGAALLTWLTWWRHERSSLHPRLLPTEAALVAASIGGWIAAAVTWGPLGWPAHLLTGIYLAGAAGGYWWLRRHQAVRAARQRREDDAAWAARKAGWHRVAHLIGLGDFHLQKVTETLLGEELLLTSAPGSDLASRIARNADAIAEKYAHLEGLPYGRVDISTTDYPGQLVIGIRRADPSVTGTVYHPLTTPWPAAEPSPHAGWFPAEATIRDPVPVGIIPETGEPMTVTLFDEIGAKAIGVHGATGSGKSTLLNDVRERVTAMADAALVQLNGAHMGDELTWEPLAAATACGPAASDEEVRDKILAVLEWAQHLVTDRSATLAQTGHSVFQPTPQDPAIVLMVDEVDEVVASVPGSGPILEFLASKQRKSAVCLILATQRATQKQTGGGMVRANLSQVVIGNTNRATESRHATGAEAEIPEISEYSRGRKGYFQIWDPQAKEITARGRTFLLGVPPDELAYCKRIVDARKGTRRTLPGPDLVPDAPRGHGPGERVPGEHAPGAAAPGASEMRARLAAAKERNETAPGSAPVRHRAVPGVPPEAMAVLMRLLAAPEGTTAGAAGLALGKSKSSAHDYLAALRDRGIAEKTGGGRGSRFRLVRAEPPAAPESRPYTTIEALAQAVHDGLVDASDEQRAVLEQAWQIASRPRLTLLHGGGSDAP